METLSQTLTIGKCEKGMHALAWDGNWQGLRSGELTDCGILPVRIRIGVTEYTMIQSVERPGYPAYVDERIPFSDSHVPVPWNLGIFILNWLCPFRSENPDRHGASGQKIKFMGNRTFGKLYRALWHRLNWARPSMTRSIWGVFFLPLADTMASAIIPDLDSYFLVY